MGHARHLEGRPIVVAGFVAVAVAGFLATPRAGCAQAAASLVADRPDFTEATTTVGRGVFQIEFGYTFGVDRDDGNSVRGHSLGEPLLRVGVMADWMELRLAASPVAQRIKSGGTTASDTGMEDLYLGVKLALSEQKELIPAIALLPQATVPTGSADFSSDRILPGVNFLYSWDVTENLSLAGSTQVNRAVGASDEGYAEWAQSVTAGVGLGARTGVYGEWFAFFPTEPRPAATEHYVNTGLNWLATDDFQWDIRVGFGVNDPAEDLFAGTGVTLRVR